MERAFVEPARVPDIFVSGIIGPEDMGDGNMRFTGYAKQDGLEYGGVQYVVVNRLIVPIPVVMQSIKDTMKAFGLACCGAGEMRLRH